MSEADQQKTPSLAEQWSLPEKEQQPPGPPPTVLPIEKATEDEKPAEVTPAEVVEEETAGIPCADESNESTPGADETTEQEVAEVDEASEEKPEIKIETAPADFRFPTTNQTRHCFTRYVEYHKCIAAKGEAAHECNKFAKYYRSLCPGEWVDRWNEQRENGTFPGPL